MLPQEAALEALNWLAAEGAVLGGPDIPEVPDTGADIAVTAYEVHAAVTGFAPEAPKRRRWWCMPARMLRVFM